MSKTQHCVGTSSSSSESAIRSTQSDSQSCSSSVGNRLVRFRCSQCSHSFESNKSLLQKLSESKCKHDEEMKETRKQMEKEFAQKLLEHRANLETVKKEAEKKLDSLNLELRLQLVKSKEENISLQQENLKITKNSVPVEKFNKLKESYEKKIHEHEREIRLKLQNKEFRPGIKIRDQESQTMEKVFPIKDLESLKISHKKELKELRDTLEKEYKQKLSQQRSDLEKETRLKLDQLRKDLTEYLIASMDKEKARSENEIIVDDEVTIIHQNLVQKLPKKRDKSDLSVKHNKNNKQSSRSHVSTTQSNNSTDSDRESSLKKRKLSSNTSEQFHHSTSGPSKSNKTVKSANLSSSSEKKLIKSNDKLDYYEIPDNHCAVRICSTCRWVEKISQSNYPKHFLDNHNSVSLGVKTLISQFKELILDDIIYLSLKDKNKRDQISDHLIDINCYKIPEDCLFVRICSICEWIETTPIQIYVTHFRENHGSLVTEKSKDLKFKIVVMEKKKFQLLKDKWKQKESNSRKKDSTK
ncbi:uncharacterized protein LOC128392408 [Panonychus citri]|uniref:uncharacterized protein LOC128392408 n=1 Tax=Panonychus citri TaxID=50023 RepID=UPI002307B744|nr:uncharacterized protein LOC128392408 [Panonychus citri]XP_053208410.1 uncharacterized protein LOC128392408 [Panonychus citri]